ncbi:BamA/TamA family outer membrane protein [Sediminitomix flava]|uniref:Surface antigen-like protein n=1 Tax=Sediminitomix flava TaxID=379075 RepID=A0A315ZEI9_SEDFL|nr:BamA/TamA family outer membrane protein [Sediminitomix flava]PWJ43238.1 surface antigen-like protein [Sediminitomix flava]
MFNDTTSVEKPKWIAYPTLAYSPETSWEIGAAAVVVYYANKDSTNRLSEASGFSFFTLESQYGAHFDHALYSDKNKWFALGKLKFQSYPLAYYGIGPNIGGDELAIANANFMLIRERLLRKLHGNWYLGLELNYERLSNVSFEWLGGGQPLDNILGQDGYSNLGLGVGLVYDNRHNVLNVRHGFLSEIGYLFYEPFWGSTHRLSTLFIDNRAFFKTTERNVLAFQLLGQFSQGDVPFNQLSMIGGEMMMRGYYLGKYRDKNMFGLQTEHRWLPFKFSKRIGAAVFAGVGSVSPDFNFDKLLWSAGGGLRVLLFPKRDIFTRLDVGFNPDGYGIYMFIGEAF